MVTTQKSIARGGQVAAKLKEIGACMELVPADPNFGGVSVGLYIKDGILTVWSFSRAPGIERRLEEIRDGMVELGGLQAVEGTSNQFVFPCGAIHSRPVKFLLSQVVTKGRELSRPEGNLSIKDSKSALILTATGFESETGYRYRITGEGEVRNAALRIRMVVAGFVRYGEMVKVGDTEVAFACGQRHDGLVNLLMPFSRNISAVESMLEAEATRGQMTTSTLGFSPL